jgi:hypothetical protein
MLATVKIFHGDLLKREGCALGGAVGRRCER